ncbi:MAG: ABC transporter substrate-binding protein [Firmicutes bacterium]|nr:ABC transporter substrate-binding protein [Bacillota bacterium]
MKKFLSIVVVLIAMIGVLSGCGSSNNSAGTNQPAGSKTSAAGSSNTFKIGGTAPLTGSTAIYGVAVKQGAELAVAEVNAKGGIQFELNYQDDQQVAETAANAYNTLKDWGMQIFLSSVTSSPGVATSALAAKDHVFGLTPSASSTDVTKGYNNIFQMCFADPNQGTASAQYMSKNKLGTKIAVIYRNDDVYSTGIYNTFKAEAEKLGLNIVSTTTFTDSSSNDFSVQIKDAQSKGADLIFLPIYYTPASLIFAQAAAINYKPKYFGVDGMDGILTLEGFDKNLAEGVMLLTPFSADAKDQLTADFVSNYKQKYGQIPNQFAADGYDCIYAIYDAIQASHGAITPTMKASDIADQLIAEFAGGFTFSGVTGANMTWNANGQVSKEPKAVVIQNGVYVGMN